ncbi:kinase-like domain-containing protein [Lentinula lateritia]|uniref:Kinase-like domain-containing protein n=1 Tax=Lentinula lateritia TaxID=40482 RepID=A0ABQ8VVL4_9AGAR|nr:kinase-like domain-containing protein [Lentinula lateritia]
MEECTIDVPRNWRRFAKGGVPKGGYRGKGSFKYCIEARYNAKPVALLQCIPELGSTTESNRNLLLKEFEILIQASGFAESFNERAKLAGVSIPGSGLTFNITDAFVGTTILPIPSGGLPMEESIENDDRSLLYNTFLVVPLLTISGLYQEKKFSGNSMIGYNDDDFAGKLIDAFAHHVLEHTKGEYMLADLQGKDTKILYSKYQDSGDWDRGIEEIQKFCQKHHCNDICTQIQLCDLSKLC